MLSTQKSRIAVMGVSLVLLIGFLACSHALPFDHGEDHSVAPDCSLMLSGAPTVSKILGSLAGLLLLMSALGVAFSGRRTFSMSQLTRAYLRQKAPSTDATTITDHLREAFRKGILHAQLYGHALVRL